MDFRPKLRAPQLAPGRYRVRFTDDADGPEMVLAVPDAGLDEVLLGVLDQVRAGSR